MDAKLKALFDARATEVEAARGILRKAEDESRSLNDDERRQADAHTNKALDLSKEIETHQADIERQRQLVELEERSKRAPRERSEGGNVADISEQRSAFQAWASTEGRALLGQREQRALQADSLTAGGSFVLPLALSNDFIQAIDNETFVFQLATVDDVMESASLGVPTLDTDVEDATWTGEVVSIDEDTAMATGRRDLTPKPIAKYEKVSKTLLRKSPRIGDLVIERLSYKHAVTAENAFLTGNGAGQPLGVFTASTSGVSTSRDYSTGNTTTAIQADALIGCKMNVKGGYQRNGVWIMHRDAVAQVMKLKGGDGQYLWIPSMRDGEPDRLLGRPLYQSEYAPNTFTTGLYVGIFGDFRRGYRVARGLQFQFQRLDELLALSNQSAFVARMEVDGMPVLEEAFSRLKLA